MRNQRSHRRFPRHSPQRWLRLLTLLVYLVSGFFVSRLYTEGMWLFLALPACIDRAVYNEVREHAGQAVIVELPQLGWNPEAQEVVLS